MPENSNGNSDGKTFVVGLALAGAISAGAYTAGVLDFLIEALEEWEKVRKESEHRVVLSAISGTSAGGICAPLLAAAIVHSDPPIRDAHGRTKAYLPRLYDAWVTRTKLFGDAEGEVSLTSDEDLTRLEKQPPPTDFAGRALRKPKRVKSLLNGALLEDIAMASLMPSGKAPERPVPRPFIAENLHLFLMTGNLRGVPYAVTFQQRQKHGMLLHADRIHAAATGIGNHEGANSEWAGRETPSIPLTASVGTQTELDPQWERIRVAALATCAFPAGLPSRIIRETGAEKARLVWPIETGFQPKDPNNPGAPAYPNFDPDWPGNAIPPSYSYVSADGGIANNEPFEYARWSIMAKPPERNPRNETKADRAVIMIDPFPEPPDFDLGPDDDSMVATLQRLISTLIDQARFKFVELAEAQSEGVASRYLVAPSRPAANADGSNNASLRTGINAIATGMLGGFGGFVAEKLRAHDYKLGRRNCQLFLKEHFALPEDNPLMQGASGAGRVATTTPGLRANISYFPLIPLVGTAAQPIDRPDWPRIDDAMIARLMRAAERRLDRIVPVLLSDEMSGLLGGIAATVGWPLIKGGILKRVRAAVMADIIARDQYTGTQSLSDSERCLLGLMYTNSRTALTKFGLSRSYAEHVTAKGGSTLTPEAISAALGGNLSPFIANVGVRETKDLSGRSVKVEAYQIKGFAPGLFGGLFSSAPVD